jgi:hypothetical protein
VAALAQAVHELAILAAGARERLVEAAGLEEHGTVDREVVRRREARIPRVLVVVAVEELDQQLARAGVDALVHRVDRPACGC